jgi:hypothetical protein
VKRVELPLEETNEKTFASDQCMLSASGNTLLVHRRYNIQQSYTDPKSGTIRARGWSEHVYYLLDASTLEQKAKWTLSAWPESLSDTEVLYAAAGRARNILNIGRETLGQPIESFQDGRGTFLNDDAILITETGYSSQGTFEVRRTTGERIFQKQLGIKGKLLTFSPRVATTGGQRFALIATHGSEKRLLGGATKFKGVQSFVFVWGIGGDDPIWARKSAPEATTAIALSPDGSLLALVTDAHLEVFQLPE